MTKQQPLGVRLNNPGNLEWGSPWQGLVPRSESMYARTGSKQQRRFCQFTSPAYGVRAIAVTLITYQDKRRAKDGSKIDTAREIVERWAPTADGNNEAAYAKAIAVALGVAPDAASINMHDYAQLRAVVEAIIRHENGPGPLHTLNSWYEDAVIRKGLEMAGVRPAATLVASKVPVTKETVGATATGGLGLAQVADAAPQVIDAVDQANYRFSTGSIVQVVIGVLLIGIAVFIAYSQVKQHRDGML